jgi:hypothetical protein
VAGSREESVETVWAPPFRFDTEIGYWTGDPDREVLRGAVERVVADLGAGWRTGEGGPELPDAEAARLLLDAPAAWICRAAPRLALSCCSAGHLHLRSPSASLLEELAPLLVEAGLSPLRQRCAG